MEVMITAVVTQANLDFMIVFLPCIIRLLGLEVDVIDCQRQVLMFLIHKQFALLLFVAPEDAEVDEGIQVHKL